MGEEDTDHRESEGNFCSLEIIIYVLIIVVVT